MRAYLRAGAILLALVTTFGFAAAQQQTPPAGQPPAVQGGKPELTMQQRNQMYRMVMTEKKFKPAPAGTSVRVGAKIPANVDLTDVPESIHSEIPGVRDYKYIVVGNQLALVDPKTNQVVEIISQ